MIDKYTKHRKICKELSATYEAKNIAYGDAFGKTFEEFGNISILTRMSDKWNRIKALLKGATNNVADESVKDTLLDLANYCIMAVIEMEKNGTKKEFENIEVNEND